MCQRCPPSYSKCQTFYVLGVLRFHFSVALAPGLNNLDSFLLEFCYCIGLSRYIAITNLPILAVFLEYLRQFVIDLTQISRHSSVPKTRLPEFFELFSSSGFRARRRRDFFVTLCLSRSSESLDCLTLA